MSFASESRERGRPVLPLAAMVDILFLLLIFFMTASAMREEQREIPVNLQPTVSSQPGTAVAPIIVTVTEDNQIRIGQRTYTTETLRSALAALAASNPDEAVVVRGDKGSDLGVAVQVLDAAYAAGMRNVTLATTRPPGS